MPPQSLGRLQEGYCLDRSSKLVIIKPSRNLSEASSFYPADDSASLRKGLQRFAKEMAMKRFLAVLFAVTCLAALSGSSVAAVTDFNLAPQASGYGALLLPLSQGDPSGVADRWQYWGWNNSEVGNHGYYYSSPTTVNDAKSNDVYMTWSSAQDIRSLRVLSDLGVSFSGIEVYTLNNGGKPN